MRRAGTGLSCRSARCHPIVYLDVGQDVTIAALYCYLLRLLGVHFKMSIVEHIPCTSAKELLDHLDPRGKIFGCHARHDKAWVFRGHGDAQFQLIPKALRLQEQQRVRELAQLPVTSVHGDECIETQIKLEIAVLERFTEKCNDYGLKIPAYEQQLIDEPNWTLRHLKTGFMIRRNWPPRWILPALCLAQHHGLPTRLLDWSYSAHKAAFFAARDVLPEPSSSPTEPPHPSLAIWALRTRTLTDLGPLDVASAQDHIELVQVARCDNAYLHAQDGVFTLCRVGAFGDEDESEIDRRPLDEQTGAFIAKRKTPLRESPAFYHFTLPRSEALCLLAELEQIGVTSAALFPDYGGIVKTLNDECTQHRLLGM